MAFSSPIPAKFSIAPKTFVWCDISLLTQNDIHLAKVQIREPNDIKLTPGTEIFIGKTNIGDEGYEQVKCKVISCTESNGDVIHQVSPIQKSSYADKRLYERIKTKFALKILDGTEMVDFMVIEGSVNGLTMLTNTKNTFSGLHVKQEIPLVIDCAQNEVLAITGEIEHIHYNLAKRHHIIGLSLCELKRKEANLLMMKIDPKFIPESEAQIKTKVSETKISMNPPKGA